MKETLKGKYNEQIVLYGRFGIEIGGQYLLILEEKSSKTYADFAEGMSTFKIEYHKFYDNNPVLQQFEYTIKVPESIIRMPNNKLKKKKIHCEDYFDYYRYNISDIKQYINSIIKYKRVLPKDRTLLYKIYNTELSNIEPIK